VTKNRRKSRIFTVSFPEDLARQVDNLAKAEGRNISELLREAFRAYRMEKIRQRLREDQEYTHSRNKHGYTPDDVERLVKEVRAERRREREKKNES
jgi:metal-responsive CopG/Arc/MetJ family transcriptional regulator